jgi:hypothetical protein
MKDFIRVWKEMDLHDIEKNLIVVGDLSSECYACHSIGLEKTAVTCPNCGTHFKYMGFRRRVTSSFLRKTIQELPYFIFVDFDDFKGSTGKSDARKLLDL